MSHYDSNKPSKFIQYLDANNLYGCAMSQRLPTHGFKWVKNLTVEKVEELLSQRLSNHGYIFEVDVEYPKKLRNHIKIILLHQKNFRLTKQKN